MKVTRLWAILFCLATVVPGHAQQLLHTYQQSCGSGTACLQNITPVTNGSTLIVSGFTRVMHIAGAGAGDCAAAISTAPGANTFATAQSVEWNTSSAIYNFVCYAKNVTNAPSSVTVTANTSISDAFEISVFEVRGLDLTAPLDQNIIASSAGCPSACGTSTSPSVGPTSTTAQAKEYLFCNGNEGSNGIVWSSPTGGFAIEQQLGTHMAQLDQPVTSTGTYSCGATLGSAQIWNMALSTWKVGAPLPTINSLSVPSALPGDAVTISGSAFGASQGGSTVTVNGISATVNSWADTSISITVPSATTGNVVVTVSSVASNGVSLNIGPLISGLSSSDVFPSTNFTITGTTFGSSQGASTVTVAGAAAAIASWSSTSIVATTPNAASHGNVVVTVSSLPSNGVPMRVGTNFPDLPYATVDVTMPTQAGTVRNVTAGSASDLQAKINAATCGDTIVVPANNTYTGNFTIPNQGACSGWILVESSALASLPPSGTRVSGVCTPDTYPATICPPPSAGTIANMATLSSSNANNSTISFAQSSHNWRFIGIEVTQAPGLHDFSLIETDNNVPTLAQLVSYVIFDRCYIHGTVTGAVRRGISFQVANGAVIESDIREIHDQGASPGMSSDSQAIGVWNSPGPMLIRNNFLSAGSENTLFGGTDPSITNLVPSDITIVGNHYWKDWTAWHGNGYVVKNIFELKNAQRVLVDGNVFEIHWVDAQPGPAIVITVRNQDGGCNWCIVADLTFTHNLVQHVPTGMETYTSDDAHISLPENRILIQNDVFNDVGNAVFGGGGAGLEIFSGGAGPLSKASSNIFIDHDDVFETGTFMVSGDSGLVNNVTFTNMLGLEGVNAFGGANTYGLPSTTFNTYFAPYTYNDLLMITSDGLSDGRTYPAGNTYFSSTTGAGFTNYSGGNYQLTSGSAYHNAGTDGKDIGVWDWAVFNNNTSNALTGAWSPLGQQTPAQAPAAAAGLFAQR